MEELNKLFVTTIHSFNILKRQHVMLSGIHKLIGAEDTDEEDKHLKRIEMAKDKAKFVKQMEDKNYTILTEMHTVYLWSKLDNLIRDVLTEYISIDDISKYNLPNISLPIHILNLNEREQRYHIINQIEQKLASPLKQGVGKFESILKVFELGGEVPKHLSDKLFELSNIRNVIVHNNSMADERLVSNCPWLGYANNQRINITTDAYRKYSMACIDYVIVLIFRLIRNELPQEVIERWSQRQ